MAFVRIVQRQNALAFEIQHFFLLQIQCMIRTYAPVSMLIKCAMHAKGFDATFGQIDDGMFGLQV